MAAEIKEPGRAYLQVGNNEIFELLQSAYSGAAAVSEGEEEDKEFSIYELDFSGKRSLVYQNKKKKQKSKTQLEAVVDYIKDFCEHTGIERLPSICMPPLPETIAYEQSEKKSGSEIWVNIGIVDEPERQLQKKLELNLSTQNYMIIGSAQSGKTNLLQTIIRGVAENYTPQEVNLYIIDFGSMILRNYANLNHCGGVVCSDDDEKLKNLFKLLNKEINLRKEKLAEMIEEINQRIEQRYEMYSAGMFDELEMEPWIILVIDSADIMLNMSGDNKIMKYMKEWLVKYKNMKIFVFMPDIENNSISFNSPEMLKIVKDNRHYMVFDDVCNIKICDISVSASKKYSKPIETGDAYYIKDNELVKIKVVRQS